MDQQFIAFFVIADQLKPDTKTAITELKQLGITPVMVTGDHPLSAHAIAHQAGIDEVIANVLPQEKGEVVKRYQKDHRVAMVGDGINDAVALTQAEVGIAIGSGSDVAVESADVILMKDSIQDVVTAIQLSKAVIRNIHQNLFWAFFYNTVGIPVAAGLLYAFGGPLLSPVFAGALSQSKCLCRNQCTTSAQISCKLKQSVGIVFFYLQCGYILSNKTTLSTCALIGNISYKNISLQAYPFFAK